MWSCIYSLCFEVLGLLYSGAKTTFLVSFNESYEILQRQSQKGLLTDGCLVQLCSFTRALVFYRKPCDNKPYLLYDNIKISLFYCLILWLIKYQTKTNICMFLIITVFLKFLEILRKLLSELISLKLYNKK